MVKAGDLVRMTQKFKDKMTAGPKNWLNEGNFDHIRELGECTGEVLGLVDYNSGKEIDPAKIGPELKVQWKVKHNETLFKNFGKKEGYGSYYYVTYPYHPDNLELVK